MSRTERYEAARALYLAAEGTADELTAYLVFAAVVLGLARETATDSIRPIQEIP